MKTSLAGLALAAALPLSMTVTTPAHADTPSCVSRGEGDQLRLGMTKPRVHQVTDTAGIIWDGHAAGYTRRYRLCWRGDSHLYLTYNAMHRPHVLAEKRIARP